MKLTKLHPHQTIEGLSGLSVQDFWVWAYADLLTASIRNAFAEFLVGFALGSLSQPRAWVQRRGLAYRGHRVDVRAAAYVQSEPQQRPSRIRYAITSDPAADADAPPVDVVVFCLFAYADTSDKNAARDAILDSANWIFFVVPAPAVTAARASQKMVGLRWLGQHASGGPVPFAFLQERIDFVLGSIT